MFSIIYWGGEAGYIFPLNTSIQKTARQCHKAPVSRFPKLYENNRIFGNFPPHKNITVDLRSWTTGNCFSATWIILLIIIKSKHVFMEQEEVSRIHSRKLANWEKKNSQKLTTNIYTSYINVYFYSQSFIFSFAQRGFIHKCYDLNVILTRTFFPPAFMGRLSTHPPPPINSPQDVGSNFPQGMLYLLTNCFISV